MTIERLGPYRLQRKLGRGGMGTVYEAVNEETGEAAAVKLLAPSLAHESDFRQRFELEIETLRKLNHPNIVRLFGFGEQDEHVFYAMELVAGPSLEEELTAGRSFNWREATQFGMQICRALRHAHDRGVIHRDLKPGNLLVTPDGRLKLSDFGIARLFGNTRVTTAGNVLGTAEYMAPEQIEGRGLGPSADLYSLGAVLYVLLARRPLFRSASLPEILHKQRFEQPEPLGQYAPDTPAALEQIVHQLLDKDPSRRIPNATLVLRRLEAMDQALAQAAPQVADPLGDPAACEAAPPGPTRTMHLPAAEPAAEPVGPPPQAPAPPPAAAQNPSDAGRITPGGPARFTPVASSELDRAEDVPAARPWISAQTWALVLALISVGLCMWWLLQPRSAAAVYGEIDARARLGTGQALETVQNDIQEYLARFAGDSRYKSQCAELRGYQQEIELYQLERMMERRSKQIASSRALGPVEQDYLEAINAAQTDPDECMARLEAIVKLYDAPSAPAGTTAQCVELARRRLRHLHEQYDSRVDERLTLLRLRLAEADRMNDKAPDRASVMYRAIVRLYAGKPWADPIVRRAQAALQPKDKDKKRP